MRLQLTLALRYLTGRPLRTTLTTLAVVLGVALFFGLSSFVPVFSHAIQRGALAAVGKADLTVTHASSGVFGLDRLEVVRAVPGVGVVSPSLRRDVVLPAGAGVNALTVVGLDPATAPAIRDYTLAAGRFLEVGDDQTIVLPSGLASELGLNVDDTLTLPAAEGSAQFEVVGIVTALPGQIDVYVPLVAAQRLVNQPDLINTIEVVVAAGAGREQVEKAVQAAIGTGYRLAPLEASGILTQWVGTIQQIVGVVGLLGLAMGGFIIFNTFRTLVAERRRDLGMLRALGATRRIGGRAHPRRGGDPGDHRLGAGHGVGLCHRRRRDCGRRPAARGADTDQGWRSRAGPRPGGAVVGVGTGDHPDRWSDAGPVGDQGDAARGAAPGGGRGKRRQACGAPTGDRRRSADRAGRGWAGFRIVRAGHAQRPAGADRPGAGRTGPGQAAGRHLWPPVGADLCPGGVDRPQQPGAAAGAGSGDRLHDDDQPGHHPGCSGDVFQRVKPGRRADRFQSGVRFPGDAAVADA